MAQPEVDVYGWDTCFAIRFNDANSALVKRWDDVSDDAKYVDQTTNSTLGSYSLTATLKPWQLRAGGDGRNLLLCIQCKTGTFVVTPKEAKSDSFPLDGIKFLVEVNLDYVPKDDIDRLMVDPNGNATSVISVENDVNDDSMDLTVLSILKTSFNDWFSSHLENFNYVFHTINLSDYIDKDPNWSFIQPTSVGYAVTDSGSMDTSVFGVLTMVKDNPAPTNHQVSPYAIPDDYNSGFNISAPLFVQEMLLVGAAVQFQRPDWVTKASDKDKDTMLHKWIAQNFSQDNDGHTVVNNKEMVWGTFKDDNNKTRKMKIGPFGFKMGVKYGMLEVSFTDLNYEYSPGIFVHINYMQQFGIELQNVTDEDGNTKKIFSLKGIDRNLSTNITMSKALIATEICLNVALSVLGAALGGLAGDTIANLISKGATEAVSEATTTVEMVALNFNQAVLTNGVESIEITQAQAIIAAAEVTGESSGQMSGMFSRIAPKLISAIISSGTGSVIANIAEYIGLAAKNKFDELPTFKTFMDNAIDAHQWPDQTGYTLEQASLRTSLQVGGTLEFDSSQ